MKVGDGTRHEGFSKASGPFESYLRKYIADNKIEGKKKLWLSGFSRSSAVANILAADMIESGEYEDVYAYLFGVPRTTKEPVKYKGIYNIFGQYDPVPYVPLQTWGYERYGTDVYTPARESCAEYSQYAASARSVGDKLDGKGFRNNPEINYQLHLIIESFGELLPESEDYRENLQDIMEDVIIHTDSEHLLDILPEALERLRAQKSQNKTKIDTLLDYLVYVAGRHLRADQSQMEGWDPNATVAENAALEHMPATYIRWLFSDAPLQEVFATSIVTRRITVIGNVGVTVEKDGKEIAHIDVFGNRTFPKKAGAADIPEVFLLRNENETIISFPGDEEYFVTLDADVSCTVSLYGLLISPKVLVPEADRIHLYRMSAGRYGFFVLPGKEINPSLAEIEGNCTLLGSSDFDYSSTSVMNDELEATSHTYLSLRRAYRLALKVILGLLGFLLACLLLNLYHRYKVKRGHPPYSIWYVIAPYLTNIAGLTIVTVMLSFHLFAIDKVRIVCASFTMFSIFLLSLRGTLRYRRPESMWLTAALFIMFAITFLFFNRVRPIEFSWFKVFLVVLAVALLSVAALRTFRGPDGKITNAKPKESGA